MMKMSLENGERMGHFINFFLLAATICSIFTKMGIKPYLKSQTSSKEGFLAELLDLQDDGKGDVIDRSKQFTRWVIVS